jgi:hypothetical protein
VTPWLAVWLIVGGFVTLMVLGIFLFGLVRSGIWLSRSVGRFSEEVGGLANEISRDANTASTRAAALSMGDRSRPRR